MPLDYPPQGYYVSAKLRLTIRFDEFGQTSRLAAAPQKTTKNLNGVKDARSQLVSVVDTAAPPGVHRYVIQIPGGTNAQAATATARSSDGLTFDVTVVPREMEIVLNGIRTADTLSATLRYIDCPVDPRTVRSCAVEGLLGAVLDTEFKAGIEGATRTGIAATGDGESLNVIQDTYLGPDGKQRTNSRFLGWVDKWEVDWEEDAEPMIHLECRDNAQLLVEQEAPPKLVLDMTKGIDEAIAQYLSHFPQMQGMSVEYRPNTDTPPKLNAVLLGTAYRPNLGPPPSKGGGGSQKLSAFDYLTDVCGAIGHAIYVQGTNIIVQKVRSLTTSAAVRRSDDPFQGRTLPSGTQFDYRRFIYGRNVRSMKISRHYAKQSTVNVEVRSYNSERKTVVVARFPLPADRLVYAIPGNAQPDQKWTVYRVSGIKDPATLRTVAQSIYESLGRNEMQVDIVTHNLSSFGGGNTDPDILDMQPGDTFEMLVNRSDDNVATLTAIEKALTLQQKNAQFMKALGFSDDFANAYATAYNNAGFLPQFRLKALRMTWSCDDGVELTITGANYIEVRADKSLAPGEEPGTANPNATTPSTGSTPQSVNQ